MEGIDAVIEWILRELLAEQLDQTYDHFDDGKISLITITKSDDCKITGMQKSKSKGHFAAVHASKVSGVNS